MPVLDSRIDPNSPDFAATRQANLELLARYEELMAESRAGGGEKYVTRHHDRGKLMIRERIELLLDRHGTGRVLFRNTRSRVKGFPGRQLEVYPLPLPAARVPSSALRT